MQRLHGPTLLQAVMAGEATPPAVARMLADLHRRLHALPAQRSADPAVRILHLDLHPDNVVLTAEGPVVIDWCNAAEGPADLDVAVSALILAEVAVGEAAELSRVARATLAAFLPCAPGEPLRQLEQAVRRRWADRGLGRADKARLPAAEALVRSACALLQMFTGYRVSPIVRAANDLSVRDHPADQALTAAENGAARLERRGPRHDPARLPRFCQPGARAVVVENGEPIGTPGFAPLADMHMLAMLPGQERDLDEFDAPLAASGRRRTAVARTDFEFTILELEAAPIETEK